MGAADKLPTDIGPIGGEPRSSSDPVHQDPSGKWYFYDETWVDRLGPYDSEKETREALNRYVDEVLER